MFIGPVFTREVSIAPRRDRTFWVRTIYGGILLLLICTAWLVMTGTQVMTDYGDFARFATSLFHLVVPLQLVVMLFLSATLVASAVAQEKDRKTLLLLLLTNLTNSELVFGKLLACLLQVFVFLGVSVPIFFALALFGGIAPEQIIRAVLVTFFSVLLSGSLGSCVALSREKTFQALAVTVLILVVWLGFWEAVHFGFFARLGVIGAPDFLPKMMSPWQAILEAMRPTVVVENVHAYWGNSFWQMISPIGGFLAVSAGLTLLVNLWTILMVRVWNPSRELRQGNPEEDTWRKEAVQARIDRDAAERSHFGGSGSTLSDEEYIASEERLQTLRNRKTEGEIRESNADFDKKNAKNSLYQSAINQNSIRQNSVQKKNAKKSDKKHSKNEAEEYVQNMNADVETVDSKGRFKMDASISAAPGRVRTVWDNPIIWREICTLAYGRKTLIIRAVYLMLSLVCGFALYQLLSQNDAVSFWQLSAPFAPLVLLSLILVNAQAVTSLTAERDGGTFDLLLVSDISPKEFVWGKLGGTLFNMKEVVLCPLALCLLIYFYGALNLTGLFFLLTIIAALYFFCMTVGVHIGMQYENTRTAVAVSLGIIFFLFVGIATCMWIMIAFSGSFGAQLPPFLAFIIGGGVGLYVSLGARNPSKAIGIASFLCPFATFYAITSLLLGQGHWVFLAVVGAYSFTTVAMLIPAIDEFDVATGRTTAD